MKNVLFRCDAGPGLGTGHFTRLLALAQHWMYQKEVSPIFVLASTMPSLQERLLHAGIRMEPVEGEPGSLDDALQTANLAKKWHAECVLVDGYHFRANFQKIVGQSSCLVLLDDYGFLGEYESDFILDHNVGTSPDYYRSRNSDAQLLLGSKFALLRLDFLRWKNWKRSIPGHEPFRLLVTLGGTVEVGVLLKIVDALAKLKFQALEIVILAGPRAFGNAELSSAVDRLPFRVFLESGVRDISALMAWADLAISGAGTTCWELAFMGLPSFIVVMADNQRIGAQRIHDAHIAADGGWHESLSSEAIANSIMNLLGNPALRAQMSSNGQRAIDGFGAVRVIQKLKALRPRQ